MLSENFGIQKRVMLASHCFLFLIFFYTLSKTVFLRPRPLPCPPTRTFSSLLHCTSRRTASSNTSSRTLLWDTMLLGLELSWLVPPFSTGSRFTTSRECRMGCPPFCWTLLSTATYVPPLFLPTNYFFKLTFVHFFGDGTPSPQHHILGGVFCPLRPLQRPWFTAFLIMVIVGLGFQLGIYFCEPWVQTWVQKNAVKWKSKYH